MPDIISMKEISEYVAEKMEEETGTPVDADKLLNYSPTGELSNLLLAYQHYKVLGLPETEKKGGELGFGDSAMYKSPLNGVNYKLTITKEGVIYAAVKIKEEWYTRGAGLFAKKRVYTLYELIGLLNVGQTWERGKLIIDMTDVKT